jgi:peptidoglycan/xylan/chitin deacetylase (PgdA/CDA1 family)
MHRLAPLALALSIAACSSSNPRTPPPAPPGGGTGGAVIGGGNPGGTAGSAGAGGGGAGGSAGSPGAAGTGGADASNPNPPDGSPRPPRDAAVPADGAGRPDAAADQRAGAPSGSAFKLDGVATWRGNATAAYSIIHDDLCADRVKGIFTHADPELTRRGLHGGFGAIAGECESKNLWPQVKGLIARGHDVFSHSFTHPCMTLDKNRAQACDPAYPLSDDYMKEIDQAGAAIKAALAIPLDFYIFPFDVCDPAAVARLKAQGYLGARCGDLGINAPAFTDNFKIRFDVWGPAYSMYFDAPPCRGVKQFETAPAQAPAACRTYVYDQLIDDAIKQKGWALREFHGFEDDVMAFEPLVVAEYAAHLDYALGKVQAGALWVEGPTPVLRYRWARQNCSPPTISGKNRLVFAAPGADCQRYATVVSYLVSTTDGSDPAALSVEQGGVRLPARKLGKGSFAVDADPTRGDATLVE